MNAIKAQHNIWDVHLRKYLISIGVYSCEWRGCKDRLGLAPAHSVKRRFIAWTEELYFEAALLCARHHHYVEYGDRRHRGTHRRMRRLVVMLIRIREARLGICKKKSMVIEGHLLKQGISRF